jgi:outer membrane receptor protein involved in Fe transport
MPTDWLKFRTQEAKAVRAPNISELFSGQSETFPTVTDPCAGLTLQSPGHPGFFNNKTNSGSGINAGTVDSNVAKACYGDPNVAARIARDGFFIPTQPELQGVDGFNSGNPDLTPETAKTFTAGFLVNPKWNEWVSPLSVSVDYFDIQIDDAIASYGRNTMLQNCYAGPTYDPSNVFCQFIVRHDTASANVGAISLVNSQQFNISTLRTKGWDVQASYGLDLNRLGIAPNINLGKLTTSIAYTRTVTWKQQAFEGQPIQDFVGTVGTPKNRALINLLYSNGPIDWTISNQVIGKGCFLSTAPCYNSLDGRIGMRVFTNTQLRYNFGKRGSLYLGVDNLFNEYVKIGQGQGQPTGWTTQPDVYDGLGRRWYAGFKAKF